MVQSKEKKRCSVDVFGQMLHVNLWDVQQKGKRNKRTTKRKESNVTYKLHHLKEQTDVYTYVCVICIMFLWTIWLLYFIILQLKDQLSHICRMRYWLMDIIIQILIVPERKQLWVILDYELCFVLVFFSTFVSQIFLSFVFTFHVPSGITNPRLTPLLPPSHMWAG